MSEFVASNGWRVAVNEVPGKAEIDIVDSHGGGDGQVLNVLPSQLDALREFFLAERDAELGRWRSKAHPEWVVYRVVRDIIDVLDERDAARYQFSSSGGLKHNPGQPAAVAREFFAAHPEPKPWHDAKPGEVWVLTIDGTDAALLVDPSQFTDGNLGWDFDDPSITAGRRIWPEGSA